MLLYYPLSLHPSAARSFKAASGPSFFRLLPDLSAAWIPAREASKQSKHFPRLSALLNPLLSNIFKDLAIADIETSTEILRFIRRHAASIRPSRIVRKKMRPLAAGA